MLPILYLAVYCLAELVVTFVSLPVGVAMHAALLLIALAQVFARAAEADEPVLVSVALLALQRCASLVLPTDRMSAAMWYAAAGLPVLAGALLARRAYSGGWFPGRLRGRLSPGSNLALGLLGVPFALAAFAVSRPPMPDTSASPALLVVEAVGAMLFAGAMQELLFRGVLQTALTERLGQYSIAAVSIAFAASALGTYSLALVLLAFVMSLIFGYFYYRTRALAGLLLAHSLFALLYLFALPLLLR